jgi:hypothetical protein
VCVCVCVRACVCLYIYIYIYIYINNYRLEYSLSYYVCDDLLSPLRTEFLLNNMYNISSYLTGDILLLRYMVKGER